MKLTRFIFAAMVGLAILPLRAFADGNARATYQHLILSRDSGYEQNLRSQAADDPLTPARVIRWMLGLRNGHTDPTAPANVDFQPIVYVHDNDRRLVAAIAIKF